MKHLLLLSAFSVLTLGVFAAPASANCGMDHTKMPPKCEKCMEMGEKCQKCADAEMAMKNGTKKPCKKCLESERPHQRNGRYND